jgi:hypothetical protein
MTGFFADSGVQLASGPDEVLIGFLAQMVHSVVQPDTERAAQIMTDLKSLLAHDGWMLKEHKQITPSGLDTRPPWYRWWAAVEFAHEVATRLGAEYMSRQVTRMEAQSTPAPDSAIGTATSVSKGSVSSGSVEVLDQRTDGCGLRVLPLD